MNKTILTAVVAVAAGMMVSVSPAQAVPPTNPAAVGETDTDQNPLGNLLQAGPTTFPEGLFRILPVE
ncbi:hypothetical protein [Streptomyces sp. NPDC046727]|uniref:hypothetical protein n=1 Tax=Streptomyces sp. NPDC046727 TaxID=3155373 RepID=UPI0033C51FE1